MNSSNFNSTHYHHPPQHHFPYQHHQQHSNSLRATPSISSPTLSSLEMTTPTTPTTSTRTSGDIPGFSSVTDLHNLDDSFSVVRTPLSINACSSNDDDNTQDEVNDEDDDDEEDEDDDDDEEDDEDASDEEAIWRISTEQAAYYRSQFSSLQPDLQGLVRGNVAKVFFEQSGLPVSELSAIWKLSDADKDGALSLPEFSIAMHLVVLVRNGVQLPATLPTVMLQVYGSLGVPVYHLPSPLAGVPSVSERRTGRLYRHFSGDSGSSGVSGGVSGADQASFQFPQQRQFLQRQSSLQESTASQSAGGSTPYFGVGEGGGSDTVEGGSTSTQHCQRRKQQWTVFTESPPPPASSALEAGSSSLFATLKSNSSSSESIITANQSPATYLYQHRNKYPQQYLQYQQGLEKKHRQMEQQQQQQQQQPPPVNFDYNVESIASNPNIRHPVPLRFSPLLPSADPGSPTTLAATTSAFTRLSVADKSGGGGSGNEFKSCDGGSLLSGGSDTSKSVLELSHLPLSSIPAIPGEWHVAREATKTFTSRDLNLVDASSDGALGRAFYNLMISPDFDDGGRGNIEDDDDDDNDDDDVNVDNCDEGKLAAAFLGLGEGASIVAAEQASAAFDESPKPYLIPRDGTLHSVLAIQGLEERLIARYMNNNAEQVEDAELNQSSAEELCKKVKTLQEQGVVASRQNEMLLVEMLTLLKLVRKSINKI